MSPVVAADPRQMALERAQELFWACDRESKGYATREEVARLGAEGLPLSADQLRAVFDALDANGDGRLTLKEFMDGFGLFLGFEVPGCSEEVLSDSVAEDEDDEEELEELLDHLGARNLFTDEEYLLELWKAVPKSDPCARSNFERFVERMAHDLKTKEQEKERAVHTLKNRSEEYENRVQNLCAEMEEQFRKDEEEREKERREQKERDELEFELETRDKELQEMLKTHQEMEKRLEHLNSEKAGTKRENVMLQKDRDVLERRLAESETSLQEMQRHLQLLRKKSLEEKRKRAQCALKVSEGIALERENLVIELQSLKERNRQLLDEKDAMMQNVLMKPVSEERQKPPVKPPRSPSTRRRSPHKVLIKTDDILEDTNGEIDKIDFINEDEKTEVYTEVKQVMTGPSLEENDEGEPCFIQNNLNIPTEGKSTYERKGRKEIGQTVDAKQIIQQNTTKSINSNAGVIEPTRLFKVVFVGDSGVGKTSIMRRYCLDEFKPTFSATIGVDFQVKSLSVDGETVALQLWDTAGQERFRSMTQQYFRRADGVIIVYDVTSETSFRDVRNWMQCIEEGVLDKASLTPVVLLLLGNKADLCESEDDKVVRTKDGEKLADEFGALFYETSAKTGSSVAEAVTSLARLLKTKEDEAVEKSFQLQQVEAAKKKKCC